MGIFDGIKKAPRGFQANYEKPGRYWVRINACKEGKTRKKKPFVVLEKTVIRVLDDDNGNGHRMGEDISHMLMEEWDSFLSNIKTIVGDILGIANDEIDEEVTEELCAEVFCAESIFAGIVVECNNRNIVKKDGNDFTTIKYVRDIPPEELLEVLDEKTVERFFKTEDMSGKEWLEALTKELAEA